MPSCVYRSGWAPGCDVRSEQFGQKGGHGVGAEPASRESENRHFFRGPGRGGLDAGASARRSRASRRIVCFRWGSATGARANRRFRPRPRLFIPLVLFLGSKQFFDLCLGYPIFWYPTLYNSKLLLYFIHLIYYIFKLGLICYLSNLIILQLQQLQWTPNHMMNLP